MSSERERGKQRGNAKEGLRAGRSTGQHCALRVACLHGALPGVEAVDVAQGHGDEIVRATPRDPGIVRVFPDEGAQHVGAETTGWHMAGQMVHVALPRAAQAHGMSHATVARG